MTNLKDKVALVTGSARGIGKSIALRYASKGARHRRQLLERQGKWRGHGSRIEKLGVRVLGVQANVADVAQLESMFRQAVAKF